MSSPSIKHLKFLAGPMGEKPVTDLPGIGPTYGGRLEGNNFKKANKVLGKFLMLNKDEKKFKKWLHGVCGAKFDCQEDCYRCLKEWCSQNL